LVNVSVLLVASNTFVPLTVHWKVSGSVPSAKMVNVASLPAARTKFVGCMVTVAARPTESAAFELTSEPNRLNTRTE
jgi:hypothetical protein